MSAESIGPYRLGEQLASHGVQRTYETVWRDERGYDQQVHLRLAELPDLDDESIERFEAAATAAASLAHEHIVPLLGHGVEGRSPYVVHPSAEYRSLREVLDDEPEKRLGPELVARIGADAARALEHAHGREPAVVHSALSPDVLVIDAEGIVSIGDFVLPGVVVQAASHFSHLLDQTCRFTSPEQAKRMAATAATDMFGLGATLYEALTGQPAFDGPTPLAIVLKVSMGSHAPLPADAPEGLREAITAMLSKDPAGRPTARDAADALSTLAGRDATSRRELGARVRPPPPTPPPRAAAPAVLDENWTGELRGPDDFDDEATYLDPGRGGASSDESERTSLDPGSIPLVASPEAVPAASEIPAGVHPLSEPLAPTVAATANRLSQPLAPSPDVPPSAFFELDEQESTELLPYADVPEQPTTAERASADARPRYSSVPVTVVERIENLPQRGAAPNDGFRRDAGRPRADTRRRRDTLPLNHPTPPRDQSRTPPSADPMAINPSPPGRSPGAGERWSPLLLAAIGGGAIALLLITTLLAVWIGS